jgi:hypothetical protein
MARSERPICGVGAHHFVRASAQARSSIQGERPVRPHPPCRRDSSRQQIPLRVFQSIGICVVHVLSCRVGKDSYCDLTLYGVMGMEASCFLFLVALAGITFETVFTGPGRAVTLRQFQFEEIVRNVDKLKFDSEQLESRISDRTLDDRLKQALANLNSIAAQAVQERDNLSNQLSDVETDPERQQTLTPESAQLREKISEKRSGRDRIISERDVELKNQVAEFESQRESFVHRIEGATKNSDIVRRKQYEDQLDRLRNLRPKLEAQFAAKIDPIQSGINLLQADFDQKQKSAPTMSPAERQRLESKRVELRTRRDETDSLLEKRREAASKQVEEALNLQAKPDTLLADAQKRKD